MREASLAEIREKALKFHKNKSKWHFHVLTPTCILNEKKMYTFVLECPAENLRLIHYSDKAERELGEELAPLVHGAKVLNKENLRSNYIPPPTMQKIINRAKALNQQNVEWHHHVLFPDCQFNNNSPKFTFVFEDPESGDAIESLTDSEPTNDLKVIEPLFYKK